MPGRTMVTPRGGSYLDPRVVARLGSLELRARLVVEGFFTGMHRSPHHGVSIEFADHRAYTQGDDLRHIDWKVFGRTDKHYIKRYQQESNLNLLLVLDCSESMGFGSDPTGLNKYDYAATAAAAVAFLALKQQDSVGLALYDESLREFVRPANLLHHWRVLVKEMEQPLGPKKTSTGSVLHLLGERLAQRTLVILISDLFDDENAILRGLRQLRSRGHEPLVWNVWDAAELTFPYADMSRFEGLEAAGTLLADAASLRDAYLAEVRAFQERLQTGCAHSQIEYTIFDTGRPLSSALSSYLATRSARLRSRSSRVMGS